MDSRDFRISRLTENLQQLANAAAAHAQTESRRIEQAVRAARLQASAQLQTGANAHKRNKRAAVVSWDLGHNPVGRAYVLYELLRADWQVDLIGPIWSRYGKSLWAPLASSGLNIRSFRCDDLQDFVPQAEIVAAAQTYDLVWVCKPRLPSLYLGALLKEGSDCPLVCDVDDFELSFFDDETTLDLDGLRPIAATALLEPYESAATRFAQTLVGAADAVTVSNVALQRRFGGHIVRHARDETSFRNNDARRESARARLGIASGQFALVFVGTPRIHKGVGEVARALHELNDSTIEFHIVGRVTDESVQRALVAASNARVVVHPNCAFDELPDVLAAADLVPLIQDPSHPVSQYQIPAKVSDALALGIPVLATEVPPLVDLIAAGAIQPTTIDALPSSIVRLRDAATGTPDHNARRHFEGELGMGVNRARFERAFDEATARHTGEQDAESRSRLPRAMSDAVDLVRTTYRELRGERLAATSRDATKLVERTVALHKPGHRTRRHLGRFLKPSASTYDIAFFWKQNDSGLYGRRPDMIARYLGASDRVGRIVHFDAPVSAPSLEEYFANGGPEPGSQEALIVKSIVDRELGLHDDATMRCRTFVGSKQLASSYFVGKPVHPRDSYVRYVRDQMQIAGLRPERTVAWLCPIVWDALDLIHKVGFAGVVADLIDDQRGWDPKALNRKRLEQNYREVLSLSDLVIANCEPLAEAMSEFRPDIHVVPNGAERFSLIDAADVPLALADIPKPIVGYVGNLRDRIDWLLLQELVPSMPEVSFVFFGPSNDGANAQSLARHSNVYMPGVLPYAELAVHLKAFDVGIVPHINNELTARMNPLKVYNYFAAGLPIVSSEVGNLESIGDTLQIAGTATEFRAAIERALETSVDTTASSWQTTMDRIAWDTRVAHILDLMDAHLPMRWRRSA